jgi:hypothetical protein
MGPWFVRDSARPFAPGCSYERLVRRIDIGDIKAATIIRGPTTRQLWAAARRVPCVAHLLGYCHACGGRVPRGAERCGGCRAVFEPWLDRERLGLGPLRLDPEDVPDPADERRGMSVQRGPVAAAVPAVPASRRGPDATPTAATALVRRVPSRAEDGSSAVSPDRIASIAARLGDPPAASRGIGTWTAMIGGLLIVLAGLLLLPLVPRMAGMLRPAAGPATGGSDLPDGAFRSAGQPGDPAASGAGAPQPPDGGPEAAATTAPADPAATPAADANRSGDATPAAAAPAATSATLLDLQRLRRLAEDAAATPAERLRAWRLMEARLSSASRSGEAVSAGLGPEAVRAGIDRVHLDAFLAGLPPRTITAAETAAGISADPGSGPGGETGRLSGSMTPGPG